jgi:hypothetical protein
MDAGVRAMQGAIAERTQRGKNKNHEKPWIKILIVRNRC